ncbi:MAG: type II CAAX endopeptidase family protein [Pseudomonadota bacterium]
MRRFGERFPLFVVAGAVLVYFLVFAVPVLETPTAFGRDAAQTPQSAPKQGLLHEVLLAVSVVALIFLLGWQRVGRVTSTPAWKGIWYAVLPILLTLSMLTIGIVIGSMNNLDFGALLGTGIVQSTLVFVIFVGVFEEVLFRGIVLHGLERRMDIVFALLLSSFLFGAMHYVNWIGGQSLSATHAQVFHAGLSGILYGAITLRCRSLWPAVFMHALWDFTVFMNAALIGNTATTAEAEPQSNSFGTFLFQNFEPIIGVFVFLAYLRWRSKNPAAATIAPE